MVEKLEHLIRRAADHPRFPRAALYRELLRSETFLLTLDAPLPRGEVARISHANESFPVWADKDPEMGGVWVPVFSSRGAVGEYVAAKKLRAPRGKEFLWMGHQPGKVFVLLRGVRCFAGTRLHLDGTCSVSVPWSDIKELSEGRIPADIPETYDLPIAKLSFPPGVRLVFGKVNAGPRDPQGKLLCLPQAGHFRPDDIRKLVKLSLGEETAWMACRHFLQVLRFIRDSADGDKGVFLKDLLASLMGFQMYGEAETLCEHLARHGHEAYAWGVLAAVYGREGRLAECATLCRRGADKYPAEKIFVLNGARAMAGLGRNDEARTMVSEGLGRFPGDERLIEALKSL